MNKIIQRSLPLLMLIALFTNCRKKAFDEYYGRPENLESPIYQQLEARGNFKSLLAAIDKAGYKKNPFRRRLPDVFCSSRLGLPGVFCFKRY